MSERTDKERVDWLEKIIQKGYIEVALNDARRVHIFQHYVGKLGCENTLRGAIDKAMGEGDE